MQTTIAITSNWQIHVPLAMREIAGFNKPGVATISAKNGSLTIKPKKSKIMSLAGSLHQAHLKNPIDIDNVRDYIDYSQA